MRNLLMLNGKKNKPFREKLPLKMESLNQENSHGESDPALTRAEGNFHFWNLWMIYLAAILFFLYGVLRSSGFDSVFIYFSDIIDEKPWFLSWISGITPTTILAATLMTLTLAKGLLSIKRRHNKHAFFYLSSVLILFVFASDIAKYGNFVVWALR